MNAAVPIIPDILASRRQNAIRSWCLQRTQLIEAFAEAEFAVTETLTLLSNSEGSCSSIKIKPTLKARFAQLLSLLGDEGAYSKQGRAILNPLQFVLDEIELRNLLCHGQTAIYTSESGAWIVQITMMTVTKGVASSKEDVLTEQAVSRKSQELRAQAKTLVHRLGQFQKNLVSKKTVTPSARAGQASR